jgi:electron transfer flavoprotein beta subunit
LENSKLKKAVLSRGPADLFLVVDEALQDADTFQTAQVLAAAARKIGSYDLILCGAGSSDMYTQQVGIQLGEILGLPCINAAGRIGISGGKATVERILEDGVEVLEITLPAVISVTSNINLPRIPTMKEILAAGKKTVTQWTVADIGLRDSKSATHILSTAAPDQLDRRCEIWEGEADDAIDAFFATLRKAM